LLKDIGYSLCLSVMPPLFFPAAQGPRRHKTGKKQVAMIAQKVVDANQTHEQRRSFIPSLDA
jgi:hypothetical protein